MDNLQFTVVREPIFYFFAAFHPPQVNKLGGEVSVRRADSFFRGGAVVIEHGKKILQDDLHAVGLKAQIKPGQACGKFFQERSRKNSRGQEA